MKPASFWKDASVYPFENTTLWSTTKDQSLKYFAKACGNIGEIMSMKHAEEKSKKKSFGFSLVKKYIF